MFRSLSLLSLLFALPAQACEFADPCQPPVVIEECRFDCEPARPAPPPRFEEPRCRENCDPEMLRELRLGETVWTRAGNQGRIEGFFPNGKVAVRVGPVGHQLRRRDIATRGCYQDICSGQRVITRAGNYGVVNGAFPTAELSVRVGPVSHTIRYEDLAPRH